MVYELEGLDCAHCAAKIEHEIQKLEGLSEATVNFATRTIEIDPDFEQDVAEVLQRVEPHVKLVPKKSASEKREEMAEKSKAMLRHKLLNIFLSAAFLGLGIILSPRLHGSYEILEYGIFLIAYLLAGREVVETAIRNILNGQVFDENFLMTVATIGAFAIHELPEAVGVMLFYSVGEYFQDLAVSRSRRSIAELMDIRPDYANLVLGNEISKVSPEIVSIGQTILVRPGEKVPLDGEVLEGSSFVDTSALTGESVPRKVKTGEKVMAGTVNGPGLLMVKVEKTFEESSVSKILNLVENAAGRKAPTEQFITKFARYYTPAVVFSAMAIALIPPLLVPGQIFAKWFYRALTMLVISCPCALVVSIPLGYFGGIGGASRSGILVKGANFLEALTNIDTVVFDKTGTLTKGVFRVNDVKALGAFAGEELLRMTAHAEVHSNHPIAKSILEAFDGELDEKAVRNYREIAGHGIVADVDGKKVLAGNEKLLKREGIAVNSEDIDGTVVHVAVDGSYAGYITISDELRQDAPQAIQKLKALGIKSTVMLTGDTEDTASRIARLLDLDGYHAGLLPEEKVQKLEEIQVKGNQRRKVAFVGDGINDAPVITRADVGIAMGGLGSDAAIEAADVVIMEDMPSKVAEAINIARFTRKIVIQNIAFALGVKGVFLAMGAVGAASMWEAVFADVGVALLTVLNSSRTLMRKTR